MNAHVAGVTAGETAPSRARKGSTLLKAEAHRSGPGFDSRLVHHNKDTSGVHGAEPHGREVETMACAMGKSHRFFTAVARARKALEDHP